MDVFDFSTRRCVERSDTHPAGLVAVYIFDENVLTGGFNGDAFVAVCDFDVVEVTIGETGEVNAVEAAFVAPADCDLVAGEVCRVVVN